MELRDPEPVTIIDGQGKECNFILSRFPAWDGLEILERIPSSFVTLTVPKVSDFEALNSLKMKILKYVAVDINGQHIRLTTKEFIDQHVTDGECLFKLLNAEVVYNNSFFRGATLSDFLAEAFRAAIGKVSEILTQSSAPLSPTEKPLSTS